MRTEGLFFNESVNILRFSVVARIFDIVWSMLSVLFVVVFLSCSIAPSRGVVSRNWITMVRMSLMILYEVHIEV